LILNKNSIIIKVEFVNITILPKLLPMSEFSILEKPINFF